MKDKTDNIEFSFLLDDGKRIIVRNLRQEDLVDLVELFNSLIVEDLDLVQDHPITIEEGKKLMEDMLERVKEGRALTLVAEDNGKVVANATVVWMSGRMSHVGEVGLSVRKDYRRNGIGTRMCRTLIQLSKERDLELLRASVFSTNKLSRCLFNMLGFEEIAIIPKMFFKNGKYIDEIIYVLTLNQ